MTKFDILSAASSIFIFLSVRAKPNINLLLDNIFNAEELLFKQYIKINRKKIESTKFVHVFYFNVPE